MKLKSIHFIEILLVAAVMGGGLYLSIPKFLTSQKHQQIENIKRAFDQLRDTIVNDPAKLDVIIKQYTNGKSRRSMSMTAIHPIQMEVTNTGLSPVSINTLSSEIIGEDAIIVNEELYHYTFMFYETKVNALDNGKNINHSQYFIFYTNELNSIDPKQNQFEFNTNSIDASSVLTMFDISNGINSHGCIFVEGTITINHE